MKVCKAKCCRVWREGKVYAVCEHQNEDYSCEIYQIRFREGAKPKERVTMNLLDGSQGVSTCSNIKCVTEEKNMAPWIQDQCCYFHPELLEENIL